MINALLSATEMGFVTVSKAQLRKLSQQGNRLASKALMLKNKPERILSIIQIGITLVGAVAATVGGIAAEENITPFFQSTLKMTKDSAELLSILSVVLPLTFINVVIGELVPKSIALRFPKKIALYSASTLIFLNIALSPLVSVLERSTQFILKLIFFEFNKNPQPEDSSIELDDVSVQTRAYVLNLITTEKKKARDIMLLWKDVAVVHKSMSTHEVETAVLTSLHSRLPVVDGDNVVGMIHSKELLAALRTEQTQWEKIIRPCLRVAAHTPLLQILLQMQEKKLHLAIVYERMNFVGIVTMEDIMEEVVGDIEDEGDDGSFDRILEKTARLRMFGPYKSRSDFNKKKD